MSIFLPSWTVPGSLFQARCGPGREVETPPRPEARHPRNALAPRRPSGARRTLKRHPLAVFTPNTVPRRPVVARRCSPSRLVRREEARTARLLLDESVRWIFVRPRRASSNIARGCPRVKRVPPAWHVGCVTAVDPAARTRSACLLSRSTGRRRAHVARRGAVVRLRELLRLADIQRCHRSKSVARSASARTPRKLATPVR